MHGSVTYFQETKVKPTTTTPSHDWMMTLGLRRKEGEGD